MVWVLVLQQATSEDDVLHPLEPVGDKDAQAKRWASLLLPSEAAGLSDATAPSSELLGKGSA